MLIEVTQGDDKTLTFFFTNVDETAYDLTGCTLFFTVKKNYEDADASALINTTLTLSATPIDGTATLALVPANTKYMLGTYVYDIQLKTAAGKILTLVTDTFFVKPEVTIRTAQT